MIALNSPQLTHFEKPASLPVVEDPEATADTGYDDRLRIGKTSCSLRRADNDMSNQGGRGKTVPIWGSVVETS